MEESKGTLRFDRFSVLTDSTVTSRTLRLSFSLKKQSNSAKKKRKEDKCVW